MSIELFASAFLGALVFGGLALRERVVDVVASLDTNPVLDELE
ncbi:MAG: hypothetical protein ABEJ43_00595 [Haloferacaceae archaeon]